MFIFRTISQLRTLSAAWRGLFTNYSPILKKCACCEKDWRIIKTIVSIWDKNMLRSRKTVRFSEQIMSADKYPSIFSRQWRLLFIYFCAKWWLLFVYFRAKWRLLFIYSSIFKRPKICSDICPRTLSVRFSEQIMSADKYPSIFSRQMVTIVYIYWCQMEAIEMSLTHGSLWVPTDSLEWFTGIPEMLMFQVQPHRRSYKTSES